ncbi:MAG: peptide MFS transporter [Bacteroidota bacterium]|jgi:POT family proton-dependent oligopeptide transporter
MKKKHPTGLYFLFFAEMWERFGYYLMIAIFTLYLEADFKEGGWKMNMKDSSSIYGTFIALVFLTPFIGGLLADRKIGYIKSIIIGGLLMGVGYCLMAVHDLTVFYIASGLVILGNGFFKPNISSILGNLYDEEAYKANKDSGYNIFYMGINIGAFTCTFVAAAMRSKFGWGGAFFSAGIGMFIGVIIFILGIKHYKHADKLKPLKQGDKSLGFIFGTTLLPAVVAAAAGWLIPGNLFGDDSTDAFIFACIPVIFYYVSQYYKADLEEKKPLGVLLTIFMVVVLFWAVFKQNGTALNKWMKLYTDREAPKIVLPVMKSLKIVDTIKAVNKERDIKDQQFRLVIKNGDTLRDKAFPDYFKNYHRRSELKQDEKVFLIPTEISQSINPGWVIALTPLVVGFFIWTRRRGKEPTTPSKIGWGLFISALSPLVMVWAVYYCGNGIEKASVWWLIATYGVITVGELCLSPMGLSLVSKLSPPRLISVMMGGWFLATSIGNKLSGILASTWDNYDNKALYFLVNSGLLLLAALIMFLLLKRLNAIFKTLI